LCVAFQKRKRAYEKHVGAFSEEHVSFGGIGDVMIVIMNIWQELRNPELVRFALPVLILLAGFLLYMVSGSLIKRLIARFRVSLIEIFVPFELIQIPFRVTFIIAVALFLQPHLSFSGSFSAIVRHALVIGLILSIAWFSIRLFRLLSSLVLGRFQKDEPDNLEARRVETHLEVLRKVLNVLIVIVAVSAVLMSFDTVRQIGISLLASAGVAGIIIGIAAQKSIATLIAGIQIAVTQPIRIDDVVIVEGEWGRIEEITLTYVVVRIWDQRRLVVPISYFLEQPFQNWTRTSSELIGSVYLYTDYSVDIEAVRRQLGSIVRATPLWDKRVENLQVTAATDKGLELRALVSASNASEVWDLRCLVRERLLDYLQKHHPESLPRVRIEPTMSST